jgi:A/G-specific adenine glycosylase
MPKISTKAIIRWYKENARVLPWRKSGILAYEVWVSEIMLQQTQVSRVIVFYERFLKKYPTIQKLAKANWEEFLRYYEGLGYYSRGRNMIETAKIIVRDFGGVFPKDKNTLMKLPGIGEYTASAILSFAYDFPYVAFDTNFKKIFGTKAQAEKAFKASGVSSSVFNSAVMDYASAHKEIANRRRTGPPAGGCTPSACLKSQINTVSQNVSDGVTNPVRRTTDAIVLLHENHKIYFSENKKKYDPFTMPKDVKTREHIKKYFLEKYGLRVSVRPSNEKGIINAQILSGVHRFKIFDKSELNLIPRGLPRVR